MLTPIAIIYGAGMIVFGVSARSTDGLNGRQEIAISILWPAAVIWYAFRAILAWLDD